MWRGMVPSDANRTYPPPYLNILQNWRAAVALLVSVPPNLPGLVNSIKTKAHIGTAGEHLFDIAYLLGVSGRERPFFFHKFRKLEWNSELKFSQFSLASMVYFTLSKLFPAHETMLERAILNEEEIPSEHASSGDIDGDKKQDHGLADVVQVT